MPGVSQINILLKNECLSSLRAIPVAHCFAVLVKRVPQTLDINNLRNPAKWVMSRVLPAPHPQSLQQVMWLMSFVGLPLLRVPSQRFDQPLEVLGSDKQLQLVVDERFPRLAVSGCSPHLR